jgi:two-component system sensor histidine kinase DegS
VIRQTQLSGEYLVDDSTADVRGDNGDAGQGAELGQLHALQVQEEERQRLAREIHDGPAQVLANAIFELEFCQRLLEKDPKRLESELVRLKDDIREGLSEVRHCIFDLRPGPLAELGLVATLRRYAEGYQSRFGIAVELDLDDDVQRLSAAKEMAVFRVVQEALQNSRKHSGATRVLVSLRREGDAVVACVEDNGQGFEVETVPTGTARHFGLQSMHERAQLIRADLQIESQLGKGTRVTLRAPVEQNPEL